MIFLPTSKIQCIGFIFSVAVTLAASERESSDPEHQNVNIVKQCGMVEKH